MVGGARFCAVDILEEIFWLICAEVGEIFVKVSGGAKSPRKFLILFLGYFQILFPICS